MCFKEDDVFQRLIVVTLQIPMKKDINLKPMKRGTDFTPHPLVIMLSSIQQGAATNGAHNYGPGTHLYSSVESGTICVDIFLPKDAIINVVSAGIEPTTLGL